MTTIELKGQLLNLIARLEDEKSLRAILDYCMGISRKVDMLEDMPPEALQELELAIRESYETEDETPHEAVLQMAETWLRK